MKSGILVDYQGMSVELSQEEILLLKESIDSELEQVDATVINTDHTALPVDLTSGESILRGKLPGLNRLAEKLSRELRSELSNLLGQNCLLSLDSVSHVKFGALAKQLPVPSSIHLFKSSALPEEAMVYIENKFALLIVDLLMGGSGLIIPRKKEREFSEIETKLLKKFVDLLLSGFDRSLDGLITTKSEYLRAEHNPTTLSIAQASDQIVRVDINVEVLSKSLTFSICLPKRFLSPVWNKLSGDVLTEGRTVNLEDNLKVSHALNEVFAELKVVLASGEIKGQEVLDLKVGDIINLDTAADSDARVMVEGQEKFKAKVGTYKGSAAATITEVLPKKS